MKTFPERLKHDTGVMMTLDPTLVAIGFTEPIREQEFLERILNDLDLQEAKAKEDERELPVNQSAALRFFTSQSGEALPDDLPERVYEAYAQQVAFVAPVYRFPSGEGVCPLPHVLLLRTRGDLDEEAQKRMLAGLRERGLIERPEKSRYLSPVRYFTISEPAKNHVYGLRARIAEEVEGVERAHFEHVPFHSPLTATPNDTHYNQQWSMQQIGAGGPGMTGWDITTGSSSIRIAILDTGCDMGHPDIVYFGPGFHPDTGNPDGTFNIFDGLSHGHGTCCAGIAAGRYNNNAGVAGVAGDCEIMAVRMTPWSDANVAAGIRWAADNGAHVISMSFGLYAPGEGLGPAPAGWNFGLIDAQIDYALDTQNCVLVAATGNENAGTVNRYPARHPRVIAVGASDQNDNRKNPLSPDGESWGSCFGLQNYDGVQTGVNVVAPGVQIPSTDVQGNNGYNDDGGPITIAGVNYPVGGDPAGDYFFVFNGTSAATPHVAGLAGLILSRNGGLTHLQVRTIIEQTAAKVGAIAYGNNPNFPSGTWNQQMGYGRIDVLGALQATPAKTILKDIKDGIKEIKEKEFLKSEIKDNPKEFIKDNPKELIKDNPKEFIKEGIKELKESPKEIKEKEIKEIYENFDKIQEVINPGLDPRILEKGFADIHQRLEELEEQIGEGKPFIESEERPDVGDKLARGDQDEEEAEKDPS